MPLNTRLSDTVHTLWDDLADFEVARTEVALTYLLEQLCALANAQTGYWLGAVRVDAASSADPLKGWRPRVIRYLHDDGERRRQFRRLATGLENGGIDPSIVKQLEGAGQFRAARQSDLLPESWRRTSELYRLAFTQFGIHDTLYVTFPVNSDAESYFAIQRKGDTPRFTARERDAVAYALRGIKWFHRQLMLGHGLLVGDKPLTPAERRVLHLLLTDKSERQIADALGLTVASTHKYVTDIFRKFGVSGRPGLTALWLGQDA